MKKLNVNEWLALLEKQTGKPYVFGAKGPHAFDCSGLIYWTLKELGAPVTAMGSWHQSQAMKKISVDEALRTRGALLYYPQSESSSGIAHIAVSRGDGTTIEARSPQYGIGNWTGAGRGFTQGGLVEHVHYDYQEETMALSQMCSPVAGYVSQEFKGARKHAGTDIATGGKASPVYAMFDGTIRNIVRGRRRWQPASIGRVVAPGRSGDGARVYNPDGEAQVYIHVEVLRSLKNGDRVKRGQLIGHVNLSGITTGHHLHLEMWDKRGNPINPRVAFKTRGMTPGKANLSSIGGGAMSAARQVKEPYYARQIDGKRGAYQIKAEQQFLADRGHYDRVVDGVDGYWTARGWQEYLSPKWYTRVIDGKTGRYTVMALQSWLKASGRYDRVIDGKAGKYTNMALQSMLAANYKK